MNDIEIKYNNYAALRLLTEEKERRAKKYWINKNGERIDITTMSDEYLENCINLMIREQNRKESEARIDYMFYE